METRQTTRRKWLLGLVCLLLAGAPVFAADSSTWAGEYLVKATCLYNFTKFTDWPPNAFASSNAPLVIGIVGEDPYGKTVDDVVRGEVVGDHPLVVKRLRSDEELSSCHVLFFSRSEKNRFPALLQQLKGRPILSMGDNAGFAELGGMVNLLVVNETVKLEINQAATEAANLRISAKLLKLARIVKSK